MSERFERLSSLPEFLYQAGSPVLIAAGALLKDTQKNTVLAQLKLRNLRKEKLVACKVSIKAFDPSGAEVKGVESFSYLDLNVETGKDFGVQTAIPLEDNTTRNILVSVTQAVFEGGTVWENEKQEAWQPLPKRKELNTVLAEEELRKQYSIETGGNCIYVPEQVDSLFYCTCGAINLAEHGVCSDCHRSFSQLSAALDIPALTEKKNLRLQEEEYKLACSLQSRDTEDSLQDAAARFAGLGDFRDSVEKAAACRERILALQKEQEERRIAQETAEKKQKEQADRKKRVKIISGISVVLVAAIILVVTQVILSEIERSEDYRVAETFLAEGDFDSAISAFSKLGEYKDSSERAKECQYAKAEAFLAKKEYDHAILTFTQLGDYEDSPERVKECQYAKAKALYAEGKYRNAAWAFELLEDYKDSPERLKEAEAAREAE